MLIVAKGIGSTKSSSMQGFGNTVNTNNRKQFFGTVLFNRSPFCQVILLPF